MTIKELVSELNTLIEAGYGDKKAVVGIPTMFVSQDGDIELNNYRDATKDIEFSAKYYLENKEYLAKFFIENKDDIDQESNEIKLHNASYEECSWEDYYDDCEKCEEDVN